MTKFYDHTDYPTPGSRGTSEALRAEFQKVESGFDQVETIKADRTEIPDVSGKADRTEIPDVSGKEDSSNKSNSAADSASTTKFPVWAAIVSYFSASRIRTILGISDLSGSNTGDETTSTIQTKRPLKTINGESIEGSGNLTITAGASLGKNKFTDAQDFANSVSVASAATVDLNAMNANAGILTGSTTITAWTLSDGASRRLFCPAGIQLTYHATTNNLNTSGKSYVTQAGDELIITAYGTTMVVKILQANAIVARGDSSNTIVTTSGTAHTVTSIPSEVNHLRVVLNKVSLNSTSALLGQIGDSGGIENTGYESDCGLMPTSGANTNSATTGFALGFSTMSASDQISGTIELDRVKGTNTWVIGGTLFSSTSRYVLEPSGTKTLSAMLDRFSLTSQSGGTFDGGSYHLEWEF